ncbi:hypothetical protein ACFX1Q_013159 [Malus domestica]
MTSHIRHFHGFVLIVDADTKAHVEPVLRLVAGAMILVTYFVIVSRLLLMVLADLLLVLGVQWHLQHRVGLLKHLQARASRGLGSRVVGSLVEILSELGPRTVELGRLR